MTDDTTTVDSVTEPRGGISIVRRVALLLVIAGAAVGGGFFIYDNYVYVSTDNAYVQAKSTLISARVAGLIVKSNVEEHQRIKRGDILLELKSEDYQNAFESSQAEVDSLSAQLKGAQLMYNRTRSLLASGASTRERLEASESNFRSLQGKLSGARAALNEAKQNLQYTRILAPSDGRIGRKSFEVGMMAQPGEPLFGFVADGMPWVDANFKETDVGLIRIGQKVRLGVDAIPDRQFEGEVESLSPATGATFSLLPPDNATGNFTKVVQRVPVRIKFLHLAPEDQERLAVGLSVEASVRVRNLGGSS